MATCFSIVALGGEVLPARRPTAHEARLVAAREAAWPQLAELEAHWLHAQHHRRRREPTGGDATAEGDVSKSPPPAPPRDVAECRVFLDELAYRQRAVALPGSEEHCDELARHLFRYLHGVQPEAA
jgi:hypothetical protein